MSVLYVEPVMGVLEIVNSNLKKIIDAEAEI
jgi:hypothetical protein